MSIQLGKIRELLSRDAGADNPGGAVAVGTASTPVVGSTPGRVELVLTNDSDTTVYLRLAATGAALGQGIRLNANGGSFSTDKYLGPVSAIHGGTGTKNLCVVEI